MEKNLAILGCGSLGYAIAKCLGEHYGSASLYLTRRNQEMIDQYLKEFPNVSYNNRLAVQKSEIICFFTQPNQVNFLLDEIKPDLNHDKLIINFTTKALNLDYPLINVACSPAIKGRIKILFYKINSHVTKELFDKFRNVFQPLTDYFSECKNPITQLGTMSRIYTHTLTYYQLLRDEGIDPEYLNAYFELIFETLLEKPDLGKTKEKAKTKGGITEAIFNFYEKEDKFLNFVNDEKSITEKRIKWMQKD